MYRTCCIGTFKPGRLHVYVDFAIIGPSPGSGMSVNNSLQLPKTDMMHRSGLQWWWRDNRIEKAIATYCHLQDFVLFLDLTMSKKGSFAQWTFSAHYMLVPAPVCFGVRALQSCNIFLWFLRLFQQLSVCFVVPLQFLQLSQTSVCLIFSVFAGGLCTVRTCCVLFLPWLPCFSYLRFLDFYFFSLASMSWFFFFLVVAAEPGGQCSGRKMSCLKFNSTHRIEGD